MTEPYIIVGMSGGVDSSVSALLLQQAARQTTSPFAKAKLEGLFMKNWEETDNTAYCTAQEDMEDALQAAETLGLHLHTVNFSKQYWDRVFAYFLDEYKAGRTPNPDIMCNREIKFSAFLNYAKRLGADKIATGHYAQIREIEDGYQLVKGLDLNKDQSYFLHALGQLELSQTLFPLGDQLKPEVRELALMAGFDNHEKKDSTGICFIGERRFRDFLANYLPARPGEIRNLDDQVIGEHQGAFYYTNGQRQGLGIGGLKNQPETPWYVVDKNVDKNIVYVVQGHDHPALFNRRLNASQLTWTHHQPEQFLQYAEDELTAKVRYRQNDQVCKIDSVTHKQITLTFQNPQRAIAPGQSVVLYHKEVCLGGGIIDTAYN